MYEANPMSFIVEQAGGAATNGSERILDIQPTGLHQRVPVFLGSKQRGRARDPLPPGSGREVSASAPPEGLRRRRKKSSREARQGFPPEALQRRIRRVVRRRAR